MRSMLPFVFIRSLPFQLSMNSSDPASNHPRTHSIHIYSILSKTLHYYRNSVFTFVLLCSLFALLLPTIHTQTNNAQNRLPRTFLRHPSSPLRPPQILRLGARSPSPESRGFRLQLAQTAHRAQKIQEEILGRQTRLGAFLPRVLDGDSDTSVYDASTNCFLLT